MKDFKLDYDDYQDEVRYKLDKANKLITANDKKFTLFKDSQFPKYMEGFKT